MMEYRLKTEIELKKEGILQEFLQRHSDIIETFGFGVNLRESRLQTASTKTISDYLLDHSSLPINIYQNGRANNANILKKFLTLSIPTIKEDNFTIIHNGLFSD